MSSNPLNIFKKLTHSSKSGGNVFKVNGTSSHGANTPKEKDTTPGTPASSPTKDSKPEDPKAHHAHQSAPPSASAHKDAAANKPPTPKEKDAPSSSSRPKTPSSEQQPTSKSSSSSAPAPASSSSHNPDRAASAPPLPSATSHSSSSQQQQSLSGVAPAGAIEHRRLHLTDFQIDRTLGTGSFGRVHLVRLKQTNRYYAMKVLRKSEIVRMKQVEHTVNEKAILERLRHPFLVSMLGTFQDSCNIYFFMEYVQGGELFSYLRRCGRFQNHVARFYAAEVVLAFENLHASNIIYRDLKPEVWVEELLYVAVLKFLNVFFDHEQNLLIDAQGHVKITDFGFAKEVPDVTWTLCGTPDYLAPEIIQSKGYGKAVDWWALGVLIYEMLAGHPPFYDEDHFKLYEKILACKPKFPSHFDPLAKDLVKHLLTTDLTKRYGNLKAGVGDIKRHKWFSGIDWVKLEALQIQSPYLPPVKGEGDTSNFDNYAEDHEPYGVPGPDPYKDKFAGF
ncbi:camp-dependent protein kinase catalytic subunit [Irineochytrium annulatum]|nr:camp-dependent protein kinase catalytic subunit [Irineochytrium annulatum]